ncbi:corrinoid protein [Hominifimenecus sp. rT4P-3]|uniref:corrinoid protein n=1 Tax=Hominifimenecus sp. rT4P-3 TaxID=3242979 RepID=UPI003DA68A56
MDLLQEISQELILGHAPGVKEKILQAMEMGYSPDQVLKEGLLAGMDVIGKQFRDGTVGIPEVLLTARAMNVGTRILKPYYDQNPEQKRGIVCVGTVQGDIHDIGKNLVKLMMECQGFQVIDLGTDVRPEQFVEAAKEYDCHLICCSALLSTTMKELKNVVKAFEKAGQREQVKIMIGGAPITEQYCERIGADCYTVDAIEASHYAATVYDAQQER